jgi:hypothetical protein
LGRIPDEILPLGIVEEVGREEEGEGERGRGRERKRGTEEESDREREIYSLFYKGGK